MVKQHRREMRIGLDLHKVIDAHPALFRELSERWVEAGHEVHIVTGETWCNAELSVVEAGVQYTHFFSIVDHHTAKGTDMWSTDGGPWMDASVWDSTKGLYARQVGLHIHFDDTERYAEYFPNTCSFVLVGEDFENIYREILMPS